MDTNILSLLGLGGGNSLMGGGNSLDPEMQKKLAMLRMLMQQGQQQQKPLSMPGLNAMSYPALQIQPGQQQNQQNPLLMYMMMQGQGGGGNSLMNNGY